MRTTGHGGHAGVTSASDAAGGGTLPSVSAYIAGDSTVSVYSLDPANPKSQAGWGQMLDALYDARVAVLDKAIGAPVIPTGAPAPEDAARDARSLGCSGEPTAGS